MLHADDCPMLMFNKNLDSSLLEVNLPNFSVSQTLKLAAVGIVQDKQVLFFKNQDYLLLTKRHRDLSIFPRAWYE
jgi:hypothetical protein